MTDTETEAVVISHLYYTNSLLTYFPVSTLDLLLSNLNITAITTLLCSNPTMAPYLIHNKSQISYSDLLGSSCSGLHTSLTSALTCFLCSGHISLLTNHISSLETLFFLIPLPGICSLSDVCLANFSCLKPQLLKKPTLTIFYLII